MSKIRVCLHSESLGPGGPIHHVKNIVKYLKPDDFELFLATTDPKGVYAKIVMGYFKPENIFTYPWEGAIHGWSVEKNKYPDPPASHPLYDWLQQQRIDIFHDSQGGEPMFPSHAPQITAKKVMTNIFGGLDAASGLDKVLCISQGVYNDWSRQARRSAPQLLPLGELVYLSTDFPASTEDWRDKYGIPSDAIVFGRSSNTYAGDQINFRAYKNIESEKTFYIAPALSPAQEQLIKDLDIKNIITLPTISSYEGMSMLYNTMDVLAHNRGESFGCAVSEAIMHGKPVVSAGWSHGVYTSTNAQEELILDEAYCAQGRDHRGYIDAYTDILKRLVAAGRAYCKSEGEIFKARIMDRGYAAPDVVAKIEKTYKKLMENK